jgi:hypothetical protein
LGINGFTIIKKIIDSNIIGEKMGGSNYFTSMPCDRKAFKSQVCINESAPPKEICNLLPSGRGR